MATSGSCRSTFVGADQFSSRFKTPQIVESSSGRKTRCGLASGMDLATRLEAHLLEVIQALQEQHLESESDAIEDNLTPESRLVLRGLVERISSRDGPPYFMGSDVLEAIRVESGMSEQELVKELFRLDREGYIDFEHWQGRVGEGCRIGPQGIVIGLMHANYQEVETAYKEIAAYIYEAVGPEGNQISVGEILETTGHSSLLVNPVLDIWDNRDLIKIVRTLGGTASDTVWQVSPLLEEEAS